MERSRRGDVIPAASRLTVRRKANRKRATTWTQNLPEPKAIVVACGRTLRRGLPLAAALTIAFGLGGAAWAGYRFVTTSPRFAIEKIELRGNARVSTAELASALPVHAGDNTFGADLDGARRALLANPWIASVSIERVLPHTVIIDVRERAPVAVASFDRGMYLVDATGHPFKRAAIEAGEGADLPIVTGLDRGAYRLSPDVVAASIRTALDALVAWRADAERPAIGEIHLDATGELVLRLYDHATAIRLGAIAASTDLAARLETFDATWRELTPDERDRARAIRLDTRTDHVTVAFTN